MNYEELELDEDKFIESFIEQMFVGFLLGDDIVDDDEVLK